MATPEQKARMSASIKKLWAEGKYRNTVFGTHSRKGHRGASKGKTKADNPRLARVGKHGPGKPFDTEWASALRRAQLAHEIEQAAKLAAEGYEVFSPTVVCDRIAIKDGRVYFVEFKKQGQSLRPGQKRVRDTAPENYLVLYS